ncbi:MAG: tetratricopeptide repeat protein [Streptosporangiaceae bacterium]
MDNSDEWEQRVAALWARYDDYDAEQFLARMDVLVAELPETSPLGPFERASALDSAGRERQAVPLYRQALATGLDGPRRRQAVIQLSSSLRVLGQAQESVALLRAERAAGSDELDDAVSGFLALALADAGAEREAVSVALAALGPHVPRYQRALGSYARLLIEPEPEAKGQDHPG